MSEPVMTMRGGRSSSRQLKLVARQEPQKAIHSPEAQEDEEFIWNDDDIAADNYAALGERLSAGGDLLRTADSSPHIIHHPLLDLRTAGWEWA